MNIIISNKSDLPIYAQLKQQIKEQILLGIIKENEYLPSIRQLAKDLSISVITTSRAYSELESEGFIATMQGKGSIILPQDSNMIREQYLRKIEDCLVKAIDYSRIANIKERELIEILKNLYKEGV